MHADTAIAIAIAFWAGAIPFGWIIAKLWGVADLRKVGSANIGATNVVRAAGNVPGALTFFLDFAKGWLPVFFAPEEAAWIGLAAVIGHCFSPFLKLRGGKGVSTTLGAVVAFNPWVGGASIAAYLVAFAIFRVSAMGSLFAMLTTLAGVLIFIPFVAPKLAIGAMVAIVLARHQENWRTLLGAMLTVALLVAVPNAQAAALTDARGKPVETQSAPRRVVALIPSLAEIVVELGAGAALVGAPEYSRLPKSLKSVANLGPYNRISAEAVYVTHADLVLASLDGSDAAVVSKLESLKMKVVTVNSRSLADIVCSVEIVSTALAKKNTAPLERIREILKPAVRKTGPKKRVFVQVGWDPLVTVSKRTFIHELVEQAGGENVFADGSMLYPRPNPEEVIARRPDLIIICQLTDEGGEVEKARAFWKQFKATRDQAILHVMPGDWLTKPGFTLVKGIEELRRIL